MPALTDPHRPLRQLQRVATTAREMLEMDVSFVSDTRGGRQSFVCVAGDAASFGLNEGESVPLEGTLCELLLSGRLDAAVPDVRAEPLVRDLPSGKQARIGSYIGVPVVLEDGEIYGTFCCISHAPRDALLERDVRFLSVLAELVAAQVEDERRDEEQRRVEIAAGSVRALLAALEARDGYTEQHSNAVVQLALEVGRRLGLDRESLTDLQYAALLHDIGKIGVPDAILRKPGALTAEEWEQMRLHPAIGERIVRSMPSLAHLAPIIRAEHERWDGRGYPDGLRGDATPLPAQIVLACDAFHAMTSDRPYRAALPTEHAIGEIEANAGSQFSPRVAAATVQVVRDRQSGRFAREGEATPRHA